jgi:hypothetical protein
MFCNKGTCKAHKHFGVVINQVTPWDQKALE